MRRARTRQPAQALQAPCQPPPVPATITVFEYDDERVKETPNATVGQCRPFGGQGVVWISVVGLDPDIVGELGECYGLHHLIQEDILDTGQRPKMDALDDYLFIELNLLDYNGDGAGLCSEQFGLVLGHGVVLSFQEHPSGIFGALQERLRSGYGHLRQRGADYLAYSLLDAIVDGYFVVLERIGTQIEDLEDRLVTEPGTETLAELQELKHELLLLRGAVFPLREIVNGLVRGDSPQIAAQTIIYMRDVYDHTIQVMETLESYRDMVAGMIDIYLSSVNNRLSEVMKTLTIIATIFMPLTFIAGVYGMNFHYMPEVQARWGYPAAMGLMAAVTIFMLLYFRRRRWL